VTSTALSRLWKQLRNAAVAARLADIRGKRSIWSCLSIWLTKGILLKILNSKDSI